MSIVIIIVDLEYRYLPLSIATTLVFETSRLEKKGAKVGGGVTRVSCA